MPPRFDARINRLEAAASPAAVEQEPETITIEFVDEAGEIADTLEISIPATKQKSM